MRSNSSSFNFMFFKEVEAQHFRQAMSFYAVCDEVMLAKWFFLLNGKIHWLRLLLWEFRALLFVTLTMTVRWRRNHFLTSPLRSSSRSSFSDFWQSGITSNFTLSTVHTLIIFSSFETGMFLQILINLIIHLSKLLPKFTCNRTDISP